MIASVANWSTSKGLLSYIEKSQLVLEENFVSQSHKSQEEVEGIQVTLISGISVHFGDFHQVDLIFFLRTASIIRGHFWKLSVSGEFLTSSIIRDL